jgi:hypothetical protein
MPDGRALKISGNKVGLSGEWGFQFTVRAAKGSFRLQANPRGSVEMIAVHTGRREHLTVREASYGDHMIASYEDPERAGTQLAWLGDFHEVSTYVHGVGVSLEMFVGQPRLFEIIDSHDGVVVRAKPGLGTEITQAIAANFITGVCGLSVKPIEDVAANLPAGAGRKVRGGELWREDEFDVAGALTRRTLYLANRSAYTAVTPFTPDDPALVPLVQELDVQLG